MFKIAIIFHKNYYWVQSSFLDAITFPERWNLEVSKQPGALDPCPEFLVVNQAQNTCSIFI